MSIKWEKTGYSGTYSKGPSAEEILRWYEAPKYSHPYKDLEDAILRQAAEALGIKEEHMSAGPRQPNSRTTTDPKTGKRTREINPDFKPTPKPKPRGVQIQANVIAGPNVFEVRMPNGYYLADETGYPCDIGGSYDAGPEFTTVDEALRKFVHVAEKFREFYP